MSNVQAITKSEANEEWRVRVDLAALYRLVALHGWDDLIFTHISARLPGESDQFLMNPMGFMFHEITAANLVKVDIDGNILDGNRYGINRAGYVIHSAIHAARQDARFVIHLHTLDGMAVSCQSEGLLPLAQTSLGVIPTLAYHDYEGIASDLAERDRLVADLGDKSLLMLRNHGTLSVGRTAGEAWVSIYALERACSLQIRALTAGRGNVICAPLAAQEKVAKQVAESARSEVFQVSWQALLRKVERDLPGFDLVDEIEH